MQKRKLGLTDLQLTNIGFGAWAIGGPWQFGWGPQDDNESIATILQGLEEGINWIDTAAVYGCGHSEEIVGKTLKQTSAEPLIATKCGRLWNDKREIVPCLKAESIRAECHDSLKRLGIDVIDLYQIHWPGPDEDIEEAWEEMAKLKQEGKVRHIGVSNFTVEQLKRIQKIAPVASLQPLYNMLHRQVEEELLDFCAQNNIGVIIYSPMQRGLLTGKFNKQYLAGLPADDHRLKHPDFNEPLFGIILDLPEKLKPIAKRNNKTLAQLAISWALRKSEVTAAIVGARRPQQITETVAASDFVLSTQDIEEIELLLAQFQKEINES
jgi:aryl-alcohol dehydrogenase-like predicted oxidoreductase